MSIRSVDGPRPRRVAVVGANTPEGERVRKALQARRVPGKRVDLYAETQGQAVLSEYDGEARLVQEPNLEELATHDVIFLCSNGELAARVRGGVESPSLLIDLTDGTAEAQPAPLVHPSPKEAEPVRVSRRLSVPHPLGIVLTELLQPLQHAFGVRQALAVILRPASDFGDAGVEELRDQTVRLLNFTPVPREVFQVQLAFNLIPELHHGDKPGLEHRVASEVARLVGWDRPRMALSLVTVPVFHGHAVNLRVELERDKVAVAEVAEVLASEENLSAPGESKLATPLELTGERRTTISEIAADGIGGFWLWAVVGEASAAAAEHAVSAAERMGGL